VSRRETPRHPAPPPPPSSSAFLSRAAQRRYSTAPSSMLRVVGVDAGCLCPGRPSCAGELFEMSHRKKEDSAGVHEVYKRKEAAFANTACDLKFLTLADLSELCTVRRIDRRCAAAPNTHTRARAHTYTIDWRTPACRHVVKCDSRRWPTDVARGRAGL
jgi:hypothetical protein